MSSTKKVVKTVKEQIGKGLTPKQEVEVVGLINSASAEMIQKMLSGKRSIEPFKLPGVVQEDYVINFKEPEQCQSPTKPKVSHFIMNAEAVHGNFNVLLDAYRDLNEKLSPALRPEEVKENTGHSYEGLTEVDKFFSSIQDRIGMLTQLIKDMTERLTI